MLNSAAPLVEGAVAAARGGAPADPRGRRRGAGAGRGAARRRRAARRASAGARATAPRARRAVRHGVRLVWNVVGDPEERAGAAARRPRSDRRTRLRELADRTLASAESRVVRRPAGAVHEHRRGRPAERCRSQRPYWVLLTVAIVLKPDFGSVFTRAVQRGAGTLLGVLIGSALLALSPAQPVAAARHGAFCRRAAVGPRRELRAVLGVPDAADHPAARPDRCPAARAGRRPARRHPDRLRDRARLRLPALAADLAGAARRGAARRRGGPRRVRRGRLHRQPRRAPPRPPRATTGR